MSLLEELNISLNDLAAKGQSDARLLVLDGEPIATVTRRTNRRLREYAEAKGIRLSKLLKQLRGEIRTED